MSRNQFAPPDRYGTLDTKKALDDPGYTLKTPTATLKPVAASTIGRKRVVDDDDYFDHQEEEQLEYQPAPDSPANKADGSDSDGSDDPLDAFMAGIDTEVKSLDQDAKKKPPKAIRDDIEQEDDQESYFRYIQEHPELQPNMDDDDIVGYDSDGNPIYENKKLIEPLPPVDHSEIDYEPFVKNFYDEHSDIQSLGAEQVNDLRRKLGIRVSGMNSAKPVTSFAHFGFDNLLMKAIRKAEFVTPTPIQAQGIPIVVSGRDIIGIAKTGSGKTVAYLWPLLVHILDQRPLRSTDGPIGLILAPTRELAQQIYAECKKYGKVYNIRTVCAYGGGSLWEQSKACQEGAEIIVCTPGRLIDLVKKKATNLQRVTFLVFDEADRMFNMGFEPQVRSIAKNVRPDRQTLMFSATFKKKIERLARDILSDPIRVIQGDLGEANEDIIQVVEVFQKGSDKWVWLMKNIVRFCSLGSVLIFVTKKVNSEEFAKNLEANDVKCLLIHGDMHQITRNEVITKFKRREVGVLVATDVAARGLDIPSIRTVINYDVARDIDTHIHRIGRTGRAGEKGWAYTLVAAKDKEFAGHLVRNLEMASQVVPQALLDLAMQTQWFRSSRHKQGAGKKVDFAHKAQRLGLGASSSDASDFLAGGQGHGRSAPPPRPTAAAPQTNRLASARAMFSAAFQSSFVSASAPDTQFNSKLPSLPRKKTRWEN